MSAARLAALALLLTGFVSAPTAAVGADARDTERVIVQVRSAADVDTVADQEAGAGATILRRYTRVLDGFAAELPRDRIAALQRHPRVTRVVADQRITIGTTQPNSPWGLGRIDQRPVSPTDEYNYTTTGEGVTAYVIDTGMLVTHTDFGGRASSGYDFVDNDPDASHVCKGHGTLVAGNIGGTTYGVAKDVKLVALRVQDCNNDGWQSNVIAALDWVVQNRTGPAVANFSGGGDAFAPTDEAVARATAAGVVVVVAAMNSHRDACTMTPGRAPSAITVGATDMTDTRAAFSNYGDCVDIFAPGVSVQSASWDSITASGFYTGTSASSPHVAGVVARLLETHPEATVAELSAMVMDSATHDVVRDARSPNPDMIYAEGDPTCTITGTAGADILTGTAGADTICGLAGDDTIKGLGGDDTVIGGPGSDVVSFASSAGGVAVDLAAGVASGEGDDSLREVERVTGSPQPDSLYGDARANRLVGGGGDDRLFGRGGADDLAGDAGNDRCTGGAGTDTATGCETLKSVP